MEAGGEEDGDDEDEADEAEAEGLSPRRAMTQGACLEGTWIDRWQDYIYNISGNLYAYGCGRRTVSGTTCVSWASCARYACCISW